MSFIELTKLFIENISLPENVEKILDTRSQMSIIGNVNQYAAFQAANAIPDAARTPNSMAGAGMGLAAGMAMANQMAQGFYGQPGYGQPGYPSQGPQMGMGMPIPGQPGAMVGAAIPSTPPYAQSQPPQPAAQPSMVDRLKKLEALKAAGVLTDDEYAKKRAEILSEI